MNILYKVLESVYEWFGSAQAGNSIIIIIGIFGYRSWGTWRKEKRAQWFDKGLDRIDVLIVDLESVFKLGKSLAQNFPREWWEQAFLPLKERFSMLPRYSARLKNKNIDELLNSVLKNLELIQSEALKEDFDLSKFETYTQDCVKELKEVSNIYVEKAQIKGLLS